MYSYISRRDTARASSGFIAQHRLNICLGFPSSSFTSRNSRTTSKTEYPNEEGDGEESKNDIDRYCWVGSQPPVHVSIETADYKGLYLVKFTLTTHPTKSQGKIGGKNDYRTKPADYLLTCHSTPDFKDSPDTEVFSVDLLSSLDVQDSIPGFASHCSCCIWGFESHQR